MHIFVYDNDNYKAMTENIKLFKPDFDSPLSTLILELEHLRRLRIASTTHPKVFLQLKRLFHILESVGSARIEGNNTTLAEYLEIQGEDENTSRKNENYKEIKNIEQALRYIEDCGTERPIDEVFLRELQKNVVQDLSIKVGGEGDRNAGNYRKDSVAIKGSSHRPPDALLVPDMMRELIDFINYPDKPQFDLIKMAQAHHRFVWIHPFGNGNGRTVRLFTYAMLVRAGFKVDIAGRIVNPTAIFCSNRDEYYHYLSEADKGTDVGMENWCTYVLSGLLNEIKKVNQLADYSYLHKSILLPAIEDAWHNGRLTTETAKVLTVTAEKRVIMSGDLKSIYSNTSSATISRKIRKLVDAGLLTPEEENGRKYILSFANRQMMPSITKMLSKQGFLPASL